MKFQAEIDVMPHKELLDPQGKAVESNLGNIDLSSISDVRIGKHISIVVEESNLDDARTAVKTACEKLLSNPVVEQYEYEITELS